MLDGLYCEFLKYKRTWYYTSILLVSLVCLFFCTLNKTVITTLNWYGYFSNYEFIAFTIFYALMIPNIIAPIFTAEFKNKTASVEFSYPNGRFGAFINKFLMSIIVITIIYFTAYIYIVLSGVVFLKTPFAIEPLINHFNVFVISLVFQIALLPLTIIVALVGKSNIITAVYSMVLVLANANYLLGTKHQQYIISILPAAPIAKFKSPIIQGAIPISKIITKLDVYLGCGVFILGIIVCLIFYRKANIY